MKTEPINSAVKDSVIPSVNSNAGSKLLTLQDIAPSIIFDISANIPESYNGSGETLANIVANPSGGDAQSDFDFWLGINGTTDGTEANYSGNGNTGKFIFDGINDILVAKIARPAELINLYNFTSESTWVWYGKMPSDITGWQGLFNSTSNSSSKEGVWIYNAGGKVDFALGGIDNITSRSIRLSAANAAILSANTEHLIAVTIANSGSGTNYKHVRIYVDNMTSAKYSANNFSLSNNNITANADPIHIGSNNTGNGLFIKNGGEFYGMGVANSVLTTTELNDIKTELLARRGL